MSENAQHITLHLDAHTVALTIPRNQEPLYRAAGQMLNDRYQHYRKAMPKASAEQLWMYVALEAAVNLQSDVRSKSLEPVERTLQELNSQIEKALREQQTDNQTK